MLCRIQCFLQLDKMLARTEVMIKNAKESHDKNDSKSVFPVPVNYQISPAMHYKGSLIDKG